MTDGKVFPHVQWVSIINRFHIKAEDVIKRRLLIDGDGTGDDRKLNTLLKTFIKWCNNAENLENT